MSYTSEDQVKEIVRQNKRQKLPPFFDTLMERLKKLNSDEVKPTVRLVMLAIARHANPDGGSCFPGVLTIAACCGLSDRQVKRITKDLVSRGWLKIKRVERRNYYTIILRALKVTGDMAVSPCPHDSRVTGDMDVTSQLEHDEIGDTGGNIGDIGDDIGDTAGETEDIAVSPYHPEDHSSDTTQLDHTKVGKAHPSRLSSSDLNPNWAIGSQLETEDMAYRVDPVKRQQLTAQAQRGVPLPPVAKRALQAASENL